MKDVSSKCLMALEEIVAWVNRTPDVLKILEVNVTKHSIEVFIDNQGTLQQFYITNKLFTCNNY